MNLLPFMDSVQLSAPFDDAGEGEVIGGGGGPAKHVEEDGEGGVGVVVIDAALDEGVPGEGGGLGDAGEEGAGFV